MEKKIKFSSNFFVLIVRWDDHYLSGLDVGWPKMSNPIYNKCPPFIGDP